MWGSCYHGVPFGDECGACEADINSGRAMFVERRDFTKEGARRVFTEAVPLPEPSQWTETYDYIDSIKVKDNSR